MSVTQGDGNRAGAGAVSRAMSGARRLKLDGGLEMTPGALKLVETLVLLIGCLTPAALTDAASGSKVTHHIVFAIFIAFAYGVLAEWQGLYRIEKIMRPEREVDNVAISLLVVTCFFFSIALGLEAGASFTISSVLTVLTGVIATFVALRFGVAAWLRALSNRGALHRRVAVLGVGAQGLNFVRRVRANRPYFTEITGIYGLEEATLPTDLDRAPVLGRLDDLCIAVRQGEIDDVVIAMPWDDDRSVIAATERLKELPINVHLSTDLVGFDLTFRPAPGPLRSLPMFELVRRPIVGWGFALKAIMDYTLAAALVVALSPLLVLIALLIKLDSPGPVFFLQRRLGFNNQPFSIYKFRSMVDKRDDDGRVVQVTKRDPRVTRVGRVLRATSLDELPQLFNVLDGTMSLVGPRPHALSHNEEYSREIRGYFARHKVKPGITGWAQVNGLRGETEDLDKMRSRVEHDIYYVDNCSLLFDVRILVTTVLVVLFQKSAY